MSKIRIYEVAKELGLENKAVLEICETLEIEGKKSHSSTLSDDEADKIRRSVLRKAVSAKEGQERQIQKTDGLVTEKRLGNVIRRRKKSAEEEEEEALADSRSINLNDIPGSSIDMNALSPDLAAVRNSRDEALARANALFKVQSVTSVVTTQTSSPSDTQEEIEVLHVEETDNSQDQTTQNIHEIAQENAQTLTEIRSKDDTDSTPVIAPQSQEQVTSATSISSPNQEKNENQVTSEPIKFDKNGIDFGRSAEQSKKRVELRGPRILGKIELPVRPEPRDTSARANEAKTASTAGDAEAKEIARKKKSLTGEVIEDEPRPLKKKKQVLKKDQLVDYDAERDAWKTRKDKKSRRGKGEMPLSGGEFAFTPRAAVKRSIKIDNGITVGDFAREIGVKLSEVITVLMKLGVMASVNQRIDFDTALIVGEHFEVTVQNVGRDDEEYLLSLRSNAENEKLSLRPPVVTVMGHVDHGKTSLLDAIRKTSVTAKEAGGITQHIGAYNVTLPSGASVTFLDTPGHEAFTAMRSRGAKVTDIVVLVVAADDGVMPQTVEAINHAKAANVPIIVAVNKIDKDGANIDRIKTQLSENGLIPEDWGGDTIFCLVSAKTKEGVENMLENLYAQAEILELKANPERAGFGNVIESKIDKGRGPVVTVLVQNGTLKKGDIFISGAVSGRVRALIDSEGNQIDQAGPSIPVEVLGASETPLAGDDFYVLATEAEARELAEKRKENARSSELSSKNKISLGGPLTLESLNERLASGHSKELTVIVKADVQGSVEAVAGSLSQIANEEAKVRIIHKAVGGITENDIQLASTTTNALVIGFNVRADTRATALAEANGVEILYSRIIYELIDSVKLAINGMLKPQFKERTLGRVEVRQTFKVPKLGLVAGSYVMDGTVERGAQIRLLRDNRVVHEGKMASLRRFKDDVREVAAGYECGIGIDGYNDVKAGDIIEVFKVEQVAALLQAQ
jgi:translation initiation factor IF-2